MGDPAQPEEASGEGDLARSRRGARPRHVLFLCVANSARSQIAEGIGRCRAPSGTLVSSAGSRPDRVRPEAQQVLEEVGIDASGHRSKCMDEVDLSNVDLVVTLCAEEECPVLPGGVEVRHWGLRDPAAVEGAEEERLEAFRGTREELTERIEELFGGAGRG